MGERVKVEVTNTSEKAVFRGGRAFPPLKTIEVLISKVRLKEVEAHINLEVNSLAEVEPEPEVETYPCPYCDDYVGNTKAGLTQHVRMSHEDEYKEFKGE